MSNPLPLPSGPAKERAVAAMPPDWGTSPLAPDRAVALMAAIASDHAAAWPDRAAAAAQAGLLLAAIFHETHPFLDPRAVHARNLCYPPTPQQWRTPALRLSLQMNSPASGHAPATDPVKDSAGETFELALRRPDTPRLSLLPGPRHTLVGHPASAAAIFAASVPEPAEVHMARDLPDEQRVAEEQSMAAAAADAVPDLIAVLGRTDTAVAFAAYALLSWGYLRAGALVRTCTIYPALRNTERTDAVPGAVRLLATRSSPRIATALSRTRLGGAMLVRQPAMPV